MQDSKLLLASGVIDQLTVIVKNSYVFFVSFPSHSFGCSQVCVNSKIHAIRLCSSYVSRMYLLNEAQVSVTFKRVKESRNAISSTPLSSLKKQFEIMIAN
mgnify:CR=1 FL=1